MMATNWFLCFVILVLTLETLAHPTDRSLRVRTEAARRPGIGSTRPMLHSEDNRNTAVSATTIAFSNSLPSTSLLQDPPVPDPGTSVSSDTESLGLMTRIINSARDNANIHQQTESSLRETMKSGDTFLTDLQNKMEMSSVTSPPSQENYRSLKPNENGSTDFQQQNGDQVINMNQQGNVVLGRVLPLALRGTGCSLQMCENIFRLNRKERGRSKPPPVPLKANNWRQIERQRQVIVQYNDLLSTTVSEGQLPPIPRNQAIVNLTGEEDEEVMGKFGSFFHNIEDVPPSDTNFRRGQGRHKRGTNVYVCAHEKSWEDILLAFSADNGLVQLYQTEELRQYVLTNRCTESRSSVVPGVVCVNDISTVNVIVVNFDSGLIEPTFINVETCRAKFVT